jgi:hypothetical protein
VSALLNPRIILLVECYVTSTPDSIPADRILEYINGGGGMFAIHDTVFPYSPHQQFIADCGIRAAFDSVRTIQTENGVARDIMLARANPADPMQRFPVRPMPEFCSVGAIN